MTTLIHRLSKKNDCASCGTPVPAGHHAVPGEFVGVAFYPATPVNVSWRVGTHNKDSSCDGTRPHQMSLGMDSKPSSSIP